MHIILYINMQGGVIVCNNRMSAGANSTGFGRGGGGEGGGLDKMPTQAL